MTQFYFGSSNQEALILSHKFCRKRTGWNIYMIKGMKERDVDIRVVSVVKLVIIGKPACNSQLQYDCSLKLYSCMYVYTLVEETSNLCH